MQPTQGGGAKGHVERLERAFRDLLGADAVLSLPRGPGLPSLSLRPASEEQMARTLALATAEGCGVLPVGGGTWLRAGGPVRDALVALDVSGLDRIVQYEPADLTLTAGAGITLDALRARTEEERQWLPLDPVGGGRGTLGATLATGSAGGLSVLYGGPRDLCLGLRLVTGDGRVLSLGGRVVKNVAGFDMVKLAVGSWGTLGVITEATIRLYPLPERETLLLARERSLEALTEAARRAVQAPVMPAAVELAEIPATEGGGRRTALLRVRVHGLAERVAREAALFEERLHPLVPERIDGERIAPDPMGPELRGLGEGADLVARGTLPPAELGDLLALARRLARGDGRLDAVERSPHRIHIDAMRGSVTVALQNVRQDPDRLASWTSALTELRRAVELRRGSLSILQGPPPLVEPMAWAAPGATGGILSALKAQFDPAGILSPGRFVFPRG